MGEVRSFVQPSGEPYPSFGLSSGKSELISETLFSNTVSNTYSVENQSTVTNRASGFIKMTTFGTTIRSNKAERIVFDRTTSVTSIQENFAEGTTHYEPLFEGDTDTSATNSGAATNTGTFGGKFGSTENLVASKLTTSSSNFAQSSTVGHEGEITPPDQTIPGSFQGASSFTMAGPLSDYDRTRTSTRTNLSLVETSSYYTTSTQSGDSVVRTTASKTAETLVSIKDTYTESHLVFSFGEAYSDVFSSHSSSSIDPFLPLSHDAVRDSMLIPFESSGDAGLRVRVYTGKELNTDVPEQATNIMSAFDKEFDSLGDTWLGGVTSSGSTQQIVLKPDYEVVTDTVTFGNDIGDLEYYDTTFNEEGNTVSTLLTFPAQSYTSSTTYFEGESVEHFSELGLGSTTINNTILVRDEDQVYTTSEVAQLIDIDTYTVFPERSPVAVAESISFTSSTTYTGVGSTETRTQKIVSSIEVSPITRFGSANAGLEATPFAEIGGVAKLGRGRGIIAFYQSDESAQAFATYEEGNRLFNTKRYTYDTSSADMYEFTSEIASRTNMVSPLLIQLDVNDPCRSSGTFIHEDTQNTLSVTTVTTASDQTVSYVEKVEDSEGITTRSASDPSWITTDTTANGSVMHSFSYKWLTPAKLSRSPLTRAYSFIIQNERLETIAGTRTVELVNGSAREDVGWTELENSFTARTLRSGYAHPQVSTGWVNGLPFEEATMTFRGLYIRGTIRESTGDTKETTIINSGGNDVGTFDMAGKYLQFQAERMVFNARAGSRHIGEPLYHNLETIATRTINEETL